MAEPAQDDVRRKMDAGIANLIAETANINAKARWYPYIVVATVLAGIAALLKLFA